MENNQPISKDASVSTKVEPLDEIETELTVIKNQPEEPSIEKECGVHLLNTEIKISFENYVDPNEDSSQLGFKDRFGSHVTPVKIKVESDHEDIEPSISSEQPLCTEDSLSSSSCIKTKNTCTEQNNSLIKTSVSWESTREFKNTREYINFLKKEKCWNFTQQFLGDNGLENFYRCNQAMKNGPPCPAQVYLQFNIASGKIHMYTTFEWHLHVPTYGINDRIKAEINRLLDLNYTPMDIYSNLAKLNDITLPKYSQIRAYLRTEKKYRKDMTGNKVSTGDVKASPESVNIESLKVKDKNYKSIKLTNKKVPNSQLENKTDVEMSLCQNSDNKPTSKRKIQTDNTEDETEKKRTRKIRTWGFSKEFESEKVARDYITGEGIWSYFQKHSRKQGLKIYYRCNQVSLRGPQCPKQVYLFFHKPSGKILLYETQAEHKHDPQHLSKYGLSDRIKVVIDKLFAQGLKPQSIKDHLNKMEDIEYPRESQLKWYLHYLRQQQKTNLTKNCEQLLNVQKRKPLEI